MPLQKASYDFVVVGGGIIGLSTAWQLARRAAGSVLLLEQNTLTSGTTWHAAGLIGSQKLSKPIYEMAQVSRDLYRALESEGNEVGWRNNGSLGIARDDDQLRMLMHMQQLGKYCSNTRGEVNRARLVTPADIQKIHPFLDTSEITGGIYTDEQDGVVNPADAAMQIAKRARAEGVTIKENTAVNGFDYNNETGLLKGLFCQSGNDELEISCDRLVIAAGGWTRQLVDNLLGRTFFPSCVVPHQYAVFEPITGVNYELPVVRDFKHKFYLKPEAGSFALGIFEESPQNHLPEAVKERNRNRIVPQTACNELYEEDFEKMETIEKIMEIVPELANVGIKGWVHGPDTHSADHSPIMGLLNETQNVYVANGFNSQGIQCGAGAGLAMTEWILDGHPQSFAADFTSCDVARFSPEFGANSKVVNARAMEGYGTMYQTHYPLEQMEACRSEIRHLKMHDKHVSQNAVFAETYGWERPCFYLGKDADLDSHKRAGGLLVPNKYSFDAQLTEGFEHERRESLQCRNGVVLFDLSPFGKLQIQGNDALDLLERLCSNRMDQPNGSVTYTFMLNEAGGILADFTVCRLSKDNFYVVTLSDQHDMIESHIRKFARENSFNISLKNTTFDRQVFAVMGPDSRKLLSKVLDIDLSDEGFPEYTLNSLSENEDALALRVSFAGTLGWELHVPNSMADTLYDDLFKAAEELGMHDFQCAGTNSLMNSLRTEKKFIHYGHDVSPLETPLDVGMRFLCKLGAEDADFVGKKALLKEKPKKMLVTIIPENREEKHLSLWGTGSELIYRNGEIVGYISSGGHSHTIDAPFGLALLDNFKVSNKADKYEVEVPTKNGVERFPVVLTKKSLLDYIQKK